MSTTSIGRLQQDAFAGKLLGVARKVSIGSTGNAIVAIPVIGNPSQWRLTKVTVLNPSAACTSAIIQINTASGGTGNLTDGTTALASLAATTNCQDLVLASGVSTTVQNATTLYVKVATAAAGVTLDIRVFGDVLGL